MRLNLWLKALGTYPQKEFEYKFRNSFRGFIFNLLKDTKYSKVHDESLKPFCFGNLYPIKNQEIVEGKTYRVTISSPFTNLLEEIFFKLFPNQQINLGETSFNLVKITTSSKKIRPFSLIQPTNFISLKDKDDKFILFNENPSKFIEALEKNLLKKYSFFKKDKIPPKNIFSNIKIIGDSENPSFALPLELVKEEKIIKLTLKGSNVKILFGNITKEQEEFFNFMFDLGFGSYNSYGIGFMIIP